MTRMRSTFRLTNYLSSVTWLLLILAVSTTFTTEASKLTSSTQIRRSDIIPSHVFIFGVGYTGLELVSSIKKNFPHCVISGTCRSVEKAADLKKLGIQPFIFDPNVRSTGIPSSCRNKSNLCLIHLAII